MRSSRESGAMPSPGAAMWMPTRMPPSGSGCDREGVVDLGGVGVVDREGAHVGDAAGRGGDRRCCEGGKVRALREILEQEAAEVVIVRVRHGAAMLQQAQRGQAGLARRRLPAPWFPAGCGRACRAVARSSGGELGGQRAGLEFADHALDGQRLLALLFQAGQRGLQNVGRRLAEAALALAVEIDRRRMQAQQHRRRFDRRRLVSGVVGGKFLEAELARRGQASHRKSDSISPASRSARVSNSPAPAPRSAAAHWRP